MHRQPPELMVTEVSKEEIPYLHPHMNPAEFDEFVRMLGCSSDSREDLFLLTQSKNVQEKALLELLWILELIEKDELLKKKLFQENNQPNLSSLKDGQLAMLARLFQLIELSGIHKTSLNDGGFSSGGFQEISKSDSHAIHKLIASYQKMNLDKEQEKKLVDAQIKNTESISDLPLFPITPPNHFTCVPTFSRFEISDQNEKREFVKYGPPINSGVWGSVYLGYDLQKKNWVAIKAPKYSDENMQSDTSAAVRQQVIDSFRKEVKQLNAANKLIISNLGIDNLKIPIIAMELLKGNTLTYFSKGQVASDERKSKQSISFLQRLIIAKGMINASMKLFNGGDQRRLHRDIKTENYIVDPSDLSVEFCDYGSVADIDPSSNKLLELSSEDVGTKVFQSPEIKSKTRDQSKEYSEATEVYSLGMTLAIFFGLANGPEFKIQISPEIPNDLFVFIERMLDHDPKKRPTFSDASDFFDRQINKEAKKSALKAMVISIDEFIRFNEGQKRKLFDAIISNQINAVVLRGSDAITHQHYYQVRYELIQAGIANIASFVMKGNDEQAILRDVKKHYEERLASVNTRVFDYHPDNFLDKIKSASILDKIKSVNQYMSSRALKTGTSWFRYSATDYYLRRNSWKGILGSFNEFHEGKINLDKLKKIIKDEENKFLKKIGSSDYATCLSHLLSSLPADHFNLIPELKNCIDSYCNMYSSMDTFTKASRKMALFGSTGAGRFRREMMGKEIEYQSHYNQLNEDDKRDFLSLQDNQKAEEANINHFLF